MPSFMPLLWWPSSQFSLFINADGLIIDTRPFHSWLSAFLLSFISSRQTVTAAASAPATVGAQSSVAIFVRVFYMFHLCAIYNSAPFRYLHGPATCVLLNTRCTWGSPKTWSQIKNSNCSMCLHFPHVPLRYMVMVMAHEQQIILGCKLNKCENRYLIFTRSLCLQRVPNGGGWVRKAATCE